MFHFIQFSILSLGFHPATLKHIWLFFSVHTSFSMVIRLKYSLQDVFLIPHISVPFLINLHNFDPGCSATFLSLQQSPQPQLIIIKTIHLSPAFTFFSSITHYLCKKSWIERKDIIMVNFKGDWKNKYIFNYVYTITIQLVFENQVPNVGFSSVDKTLVIFEYKSRYISVALAWKWQKKKKILSAWKEPFCRNCLPISLWSAFWFM